jgi:hypothetical protein
MHILDDVQAEAMRPQSAGMLERLSYNVPPNSTERHGIVSNVVISE